ncbi:TPA: hypothetical protein ACOBTX_001412 [Enterococcus faecium]
MNGFFFDVYQVKFVVETAQRNVKNAFERSIHLNQASIELLEANWRDGLQKAEQAAPSLSSLEVRETLEVVGVIEETQVTIPREKCLQESVKLNKGGTLRRLDMRIYQKTVNSSQKTRSWSIK